MSSRLSPLLLLLSFFFSGCAGLYFQKAPVVEAPPPLGELSRLPQREDWFGVIFNGEKIGLTHYRIEERNAPAGTFEIFSEALLRFKVLGLGKEVVLKESGTVAADMTLIDFVSDMTLDGKKIILSGKVREKELIVWEETERRKEEKIFPLSQPLFPGLAINFYPLLHGLQVGRNFRYLIYSPQSRSLQEVSQEVVGYESSKLFPGEAFKVKTSMAGLSTTSWINARGETLLEMAIMGALLTVKEDEPLAKQFLYEKSLAKSDLLLDYSLVKADKMIPNPRALKSLQVELEGFPDAGLFVCTDWQEVQIKKQEKGWSGRYTLKASSPLSERALLLPIAGPQMKAFLRASAAIQSMSPEITKQAEDILQGEGNALLAVKKIVHWMKREVKSSLQESFSALDVLHSKQGECQAHSFLYTALARAAGIPTKIVSGLVFVEGLGFLYHSWTESYVGEWVAVDPTFGQVGADATHIKLIEGERFEDLSPLIHVIGRLKARVIGYE